MSEALPPTVPEPGSSLPSQATPVWRDDSGAWPKRPNVEGPVAWIEGGYVPPWVRSPQYPTS